MRTVLIIYGVLITIQALFSGLLMLVVGHLCNSMDRYRSVLLQFSDVVQDLITSHNDIKQVYGDAITTIGQTLQDQQAHRAEPIGPVIISHQSSPN